MTITFAIEGGVAVLAVYTTHRRTAARHRVLIGVIGRAVDTVREGGTSRGGLPEKNQGFSEARQLVGDCRQPHKGQHSSTGLDQLGLVDLAADSRPPLLRGARCF
jgi:hypothetical protein